MSHLTSTLSTRFDEVEFIEGPPGLTTGYWSVVDEKVSSHVVPPALRAEVAVLDAQLNEAKLDIHCQFFGPLFRGERRFGVPGQAREWRFFRLADDPLWQSSPWGFPLPDATRAELEEVVQAAPQLFSGPYELFLAHEFELKPGPATSRSSWKDLEPVPSQQTISASAQLGRVAGQAMRLATMPYRGAVATITAAAKVGVAAAAVGAVVVPIAAVATVGAVGSLVALDPLLLLGRVAPGRPLIPGEMAAFYPLAKWIYA